MAKRWTGLLGGLILACLNTASFAAGDIEIASNLQAEAARAAKAGGPLIVIYSREDCSFCKAVKRDYLKPLAANPRYRDRIVIRQVNQDGEAQPLIDFRGNASTHALVAAAQKVKLVPVVAFYGPDGRQLAEPIVGARLPDFYQSYLENAVEQSANALKKP